MIALFLAVAGAPERELIDRIVAVVNDEIITLSEVEAAAKPFMEHNETEEKRAALYKDILDQLVSERLVSQQIEEAKIDVTDDEVERAIKDILKQNKLTAEQLEEAIESRGMSMGQYKQDLESQLVRLKLIDMKVRSRVVIPETEIQAEYDKRVATEKKEKLVHIRHLFFRFGDSPDPEERQRVIARARKARQRVIDGEAFDVVAKEVSEGPTAASGGDLGEVTESGLLPELAKGLVGLEVDAITPPLESTNGVHVVQLLERKQRQPTSYASVRDEIYSKLYQKEVERQMKVWVDELEAQSAIDIRL
jgi:peptidyl-prolyl cis-trans isomerase SurA